MFWWTYVSISIDYIHIHSLRSGSRVIPNDELDRRERTLPRPNLMLRSCQYNLAGVLTNLHTVNCEIGVRFAWQRFFFS